MGISGTARVFADHTAAYGEDRLAEGVDVLATADEFGTRTRRDP